MGPGYGTVGRRGSGRACRYIFGSGMANGDVSNLRFRKRFRELEQRRGMTLTEVAIALGWETGPSRKPDASRVARVLGLTAREGKRRTRMRYETAVMMADVLDLDYVEVGV